MAGLMGRVLVRKVISHYLVIETLGGPFALTIPPHKTRVVVERSFLPLRQIF
jgi:hypothetical protein